MNIIYKSIINYLFPVVKRKPIPKKIRTQVWIKYNGPGEYGICYACGRNIDIYNYHAAHVVSHKDGGKAIVENLRPTCAHCNTSCGKKNLYTFIKDKKLKGPGCKFIKKI